MTVDDIQCVVVGPIQTNCYIVDTHDGGCIVIDPGDDAASIQHAIHDRFVHVLIATHGHFDHVCAIPELIGASQQGWMISKPDESPALRASEQAARFGVVALDLTYAPSHYLVDDEVLSFGELKVRTIHSPGHTPGCMVLIDDDAHIAFSGDVLFEQSCGRCDLTGGDVVAMRESLRNLAKLPAQTTILPGHGNPTTLRRAQVENPPFASAYREIYSRS